MEIFPGITSAEFKRKQASGEIIRYTCVPCSGGEGNPTPVHCVGYKRANSDADIAGTQPPTKRIRKAVTTQARNHLFSFD